MPKSAEDVAEIVPDVKGEKRDRPHSMIVKAGRLEAGRLEKYMVRFQRANQCGQGGFRIGGMR